MNITMIAGTFYVLLLFSGMGFRAASFLTAVIVAVYIGLAGAGIPIQRAGYTAILVLLGTLAGRPTHLLNSLCLSFLVILAWMPQSLWSVGFQLSFLCVLSLILFLPLFSRVSLWTLSLGSSVSVLAGTFPVILYYFNIFSPVSILANLVAIPLCDGALFTALFALLLGSVPLAGPFLIMVSSGIIAGVLAWVKALSAWRWGYWFLERPMLWELGIYYAILGGLLFTYRRIVWMKRFWMGVFVLGWAGISGLMMAGRGGGEFQMTLLAGGGNQVAHARFSNGAHWIFNAGRSFPSDQGEWLIAPYLRTGGIRSLEGIFVSDLSKKNTGGLAALLRDFPIRYFLHPVARDGATAGFSGMIRKAGGIMQGLRPGDGVAMADEVIRVQACTAKGTALEISTGPWRIVLVSGWDADLFKTLFENGDEEALHAVLLPSPGNNPVPIEFDDWVREARPMLVVSPGSSPRMSDLLERERISFLDPSRVGAVSFLRKGDRLELSSFLKGMLGFFSYS